MSENDTTSEARDRLDTKAVAIRGNEDGRAPHILAKGRGHNAEKILEIAFAEGVKVRQDKDLTELLDAFEVDCPVPLEALHAVSLILERVYAENNRLQPEQGERIPAASMTETSGASAAQADTKAPSSDPNHKSSDNGQ